jgi:biopolymer transport protein ExbD
MKFPRNSKLLRSPFDMAPFAAVLFLIVIFLMLGAILPIPGVPLRLPVATGLPGTDQPTIALAVAADGRCFLENQLVTEPQLAAGLHAAATASPAPLTLIINADQSVTYDQLMRVTLLAWRAGITNALLATQPAPGDTNAFRP